MVAAAALGLTLGLATGTALRSSSRAHAQSRAYRECYAQALVLNDHTMSSAPQTPTAIPTGWTIVGVHGRPAAVVLCR